MGAAALSSDYRSLSRQPPSDPDIQATLSDFLTYTEHFPAHLTRALALITDQRLRAERKVRSVHDDATTWSQLPSLKDGRPDPAKLRRDISYALEEAERASRMAVEEAVRLDEMCARESRRLDVVLQKLKAQPLPPSRDASPTPSQPALTSPNLKKERRMSTRVDESKQEKSAKKSEDKAATKLRGRKIMVPGEVLPPPDPNAVPESASEWTTPRQSSPLDDEPYTQKDKKTVTPRPRSDTPKPNKEKKTPKPRVPRTPGQPGTNAHSAVAGISTSNALLALTKPPDDAVNGTKWYPWMALTEWEMAQLRKRMKKNAIWVPSQTMVRRELKNLGRGLAGKEEARKEAAATGTHFIDEQTKIDPTKTLLSGEDAYHTAVLLDDRLYEGGFTEDQDQELINRGMKLNEAKKLKRQRMLEEQALQAQIAREQNLDPADIKQAIPSGDVKKRKRETTPPVSHPSASHGASTSEAAIRPAPKKLKIAAPTVQITGTSKVPLAPAGVSASPKSTAARYRRAATPPANGRKSTLVLKAGKAVSEEPPSRRATLRRSSNASLPNGTPIVSPGRSTGPSTAANGRRTRRPAPGILTTADDDSTKVGFSKRKAAPRKKGAARLSSDAAAVQGAMVEDDIDPDEPRYCLCGDVSWGTMIACDNDDCEKEWFHLSCVGLQELPPRRTKWYCPDCRKKLKLGVASSGLVGRTSIGGR